MRRLLTTTLALAFLAPCAASAQAIWDAPSFMRSGSPAGLTIAVTDSDPGDGLAVLGLWRRAAAPTGIGFRAGIAEAPGDEVAGILGIDVSGSLTGLAEPGGPEAIWWTGAGFGIGDDFIASFPLGLVFGWTGRDEGVSFMPYAGGHVVLDVVTEGDDELDLEGVVDLGLDIAFESGWIARFGAALGGRESLGLGMRIPTSR